MLKKRVRGRRGGGGRTYAFVVNVDIFSGVECLASRTWDFPFEQLVVLDFMLDEIFDFFLQTHCGLQW